jgi:hypothetical protein
MGIELRNTKLTILVLLFIFSLSLPASAQIFKAGCNVNYYSIKDSIFQEAYGTGNLMYGASLSLNLVWKIEVRAEANYFQDKGDMTATQEDITFTLIPLVIGARIRIFEKKFSPYLGFGMDICSYKEDYPERFEDVDEKATGFHVEIGTYFYLPRKFYADINVRYTKLDVSPFGEIIELGGLQAGVGIGYRF